MAVLHDVPGCCTMKMIVGLGDTTVAGVNARAATMGADQSVAALEAEVQRLENDARRNGNAIIMASTNNEQESGVQALRNRGFAHSKWATKTRHPETQVRIWHKRLNP